MRKDREMDNYICANCDEPCETYEYTEEFYDDAYGFQQLCYYTELRSQCCNDEVCESC